MTDRNMTRIEINKHEKIVLQVGYLQEITVFIPSMETEKYTYAMRVFI
jgi:hypothetical protein